MKQITIFGGTGFIGRHLVRRLSKTGVIIRVPTRDIDKALMLKPMGDVGQIVPIACNIQNDASIAAAIGPSDAVINLVGILFEKGRKTFQSVHVETAARIARIAKEQGAARYVHISAIGADVSSLSSYARSKADGESATRAFFPQTTILRPSIVFGPEDNFFNRFAGLARLSPFLPLIGGGATRFQPVYVGDVAEAIIRTVAILQCAGKIYELGGREILSFCDLMERMLQVIERKARLISIPFALADLQATFLQLLPQPLLTRDQVRLLRTDNIVHTTVRGLGDLGIEPTSLEIILPTYLARFRPADVAHERSVARFSA